MGLNQYKRNIKKIDKLFIWVILLFMPLSTYATPIEGVTVGDVTLLIMLFVLLINILGKRLNLKQVISLPLLFFLVYILCYTLIFWLFNNELIAVSFLSLSRYLLYLLVVIIGSKFFIDEKYILNNYIKLATVFSIYLLIQYLTYYLFRIILPSAFFGLPNTAINISLQEYVNKSYLLYRPSSVFIEPAHFAAYQIPALFLLLNSNKSYINYKGLVSLILTLGLMFSGSSTAFIMLIICWFKPVIKLFKRMNLKTIVFIFFSGVIIAWFFSLEYTQRATARLFGQSLSSEGSAIYGRLGNVNYLFNDISLVSRILGKGFGYNIDYYLPSYGTLVLYMGYLGLLVFIITMFVTYVYSSKIGKRLIMLSLIMFAGTNGLFGITSVLYFTLIYSEIGSIGLSTIKSEGGGT